MLSRLLHAKLMWMPACYILIYYMQSCVVLYLGPFLLNGFGNLLAFVAVLFEASVCKLSGHVVVQIRGQGAINLLVLGLIPPKPKFYFSRLIFISFLISLCGGTCQ